MCLAKPVGVTILGLPYSAVAQEEGCLVYVISVHTQSESVEQVYMIWSANE